MVHQVCNQEIKDFLQLIDSKFEECVTKIDRTHPDWGFWSRGMNLIIRQRVEVDKPLEQIILYKKLFIYWVEKSRLLRLAFQHKFAWKHGKSNKMRKEIEMINWLKDQILNVEEHEEIKGEIEDLIR